MLLTTETVGRAHALARHIARRFELPKVAVSCRAIMAGT